MKSMIVMPMATQNKIKPIILFIFLFSRDAVFKYIPGASIHKADNIYYAGKRKVISF